MRQTCSKFSLPVILVAAAVGLVTTLASVPAAQAEDDKALRSVLGEIEWGDSKDTVLDKLRQRMLDKLRKRKELRHDRVRMQRARKRVLDRFKVIKDSYTKLQGEQTGYAVSVIAGEFTKNNNESLLRIKDRVAQRFFFFKDGQFYKMVVAYKQNYLKNIGFEAFISQVARKYGRPEATDYTEIGGEEQMALARWEDDETILRVKNEKEFFGTYVMVFSDREKVEQLKAANEDFGGSDKDEAEVSSRVKDLAADSGSDENRDVVDSMLGESIEVELEDQQAAAKKAKEEEEKEKAEQEKKKGQTEKVAEKKDKKKESSGSKPKSGGKDRDFSDISADSDEEDDQLIIY